ASPLETMNGCGMLRFEDPEGQRLALVDDGGAPFDGEPWDGSEVPVAHAIRGLYGVQLTVPQLSQVEPILTRLLDFKRGSETAEAVEQLGKRLALPPFLEPRRTEIEARLKPL